MTRQVVVEIHTAAWAGRTQGFPGAEWAEAGAIDEASPPASISTHAGSLRDVLIFGWHEGDGPAVWRSIGGLDTETPSTRMITTLGLERLADLDRGPYEQPIITPGGRHTTVRFRVREAVDG